MTHSATRTAPGSVANIGGETDPLTVTWIWKSDRPLDIRIGFLVDGSTRPTWWGLPRDFLLRAVTCSGRLTTDQFVVQRVADALCMVLLDEVTDESRAIVLTAVAPLRDVLVESYARVPPGLEPVDVDETIRRCMEGAS